MMSPIYGPGTVLEAIAMPDTFFISLNQDGDTEDYLEAFLEKMKENGIHASLQETVYGTEPYVALRETLGLITPKT